MAEKDAESNGELTDEEQAMLDKSFKGALQTLEDRRNEDGEIAKLASESQGSQSVLQRAMTATDDKHYRQALLTSFTDEREAVLATAAIEERLAFGVPITPVVDRIHAKASVTMGTRLLSIFNTITSTTFTTNRTGKFKNKQSWWERGKDKNNGGIGEQDKIDSQ